jgi:hypothetical protein
MAGRRRFHALVAALLIVTALLTGCGATEHATGAPGPLLSAQSQSQAVCARIHPGTAWSVAVLARTAAADLKQHHIVPNPWADIPARTVIFTCMQPDGQQPAGYFVDSAGSSTPIPGGDFSGCVPPPQVPASAGTVAGVLVRPTGSCSLEVASNSPSGAGTAAGAVAVIVLAGVAVFFGRRRWKKSALNPNAEIQPPL